VRRDEGYERRNEKPGYHGMKGGQRRNTHVSKSSERS